MKCMASDITEVITTRLKTMGMSQAQFAECISATPAQVSIFLRKQGSISVDSINKSFDLIGVNVSMYKKRIDFAKEVADFLKKKGIRNIDSWTKIDLADFTQMKEVLLFHDVQDQNEYISIMTSGLIDYESTFPYFKSLVAYFLNVEESTLTSSSAKNALYKLMDENKNEEIIANRSVAALAIGAIAVSLLPVVTIAASVAMTTCKQIGAFSLFSSTMKDSLFTKSIDYITKKII